MSDLFGGSLKAYWEEHWWGMPEFVSEDLKPYQKIIVSFRSLEEVRAFGELMGQRFTSKTKSAWFTPEDGNDLMGLSYE